MVQGRAETSFNVGSYQILAVKAYRGYRIKHKTRREFALTVRIFDSEQPQFGRFILPIMYGSEEHFEVML